MYDALLQHIKKHVPLTAEEEAIVSSYLRHKSVSKKEYLLKQDEVCTASYFVAKGCLRMYTVTDNATEQMIQFAIDNWWMADYTSLNMHKPSPFFIQAVENCEIIALPGNTQEELLARVPAMERYFRIVLQRAYAATQMRVHFIYNMTAKQRYEYFNNLFPGFVQRVPQYMLASYLGFSAELLSKIRAGKV
jgi:CRP/FNR family transcriptional regulator